MNNLCISNLVYGQPYTHIFLNFHLKSLLANLNSYALENSCYILYTEESNISVIESHENFQLLCDKLKVTFVTLDGNKPTYELRYHYQTIQSSESIRYALENKMLLHLTAADVYYGINFFKNSSDFMSKGHDAIAHQPMRIAYESAASYLSTDKSLSVDDLFLIGFHNPHPLWTSQNWHNPYFSVMPYQLLWSDQTAICLRGFSISPSIFIPQESMLESLGSADITIFQHFKNPYVSYDWSELPMVELQQLSSFYPSFSNKKSNIQDIAIWAKKYILKENFSNLARYTIYKRINDPINEGLVSESKRITDAIMATLRF